MCLFTAPKTSKREIAHRDGLYPHAGPHKGISDAKTCIQVSRETVFGAILLETTVVVHVPDKEEWCN